MKRSQNTPSVAMHASAGDPRLPIRFWSKVRLDDGGCWIWTAYADRDGYPRFAHQGTQRAAHRVSFGALVRKLKRAEIAHHDCRVRACVNPAHIVPMSKSGHDKLHRGESRTSARLRSHCRNGHEMTPENTQWNSGRGTRLCRVCRRAQRRSAASSGES